MFAYEKHYVDRVAGVRAQEIAKVQQGGVMRALNFSLYFAASALIAFVCVRYRFALF